MKKIDHETQTLSYDALAVTPTLPIAPIGAGHKPILRRQSLDYDTNKESDLSAILCKEPTLTQQQFLEESDINFIADRYGLTGEMPQVQQLPSYGDFTGIYDFQSAQNSVRRATEQFMTLPAKLRAKFDNQPQKLLAFLEDPDNRAEAEFLGLVNKPEETIPSPKDDPARKGKGESPTPEPKGSGPSPKTPKTDT